MKEEEGKCFGQEIQTETQRKNSFFDCYLECHVRPNDRTNRIPRSPVQEKKKKKKKKKQKKRRSEKNENIKETNTQQKKTCHRTYYTTHHVVLLFPIH